MPYESPLERRANSIAARIGKSVDAFAGILTPPGQRPPFTRQMGRRESLAWWRANVDNEYGKEALKYLNPIEQIEMRQAIARPDPGTEYLGGADDDVGLEGENG